MAIDPSASTSRKRVHQPDQEESSRRIRRVKIYSDHTSPSVTSPNVQKRPHESESAAASSRGQPPAKKVCTSDTSLSFTEHVIDHWCRFASWPDEYFEPESMPDVFARPVLRKKRSEVGSQVSTSTPSDQRSGEDKTKPYKDPRYRDQLISKGVFMGIPPDDKKHTRESEQWCKTLLEVEQTVPENTLFQDRSFVKLFNCLQGKNEARIVQDISRLIVPSAESLYILGAEEMGYLSESVNEGWNSAIPLLGTRPQPDYSVGFNSKAFTDEQNEKLAPYVGSSIGYCQSYFLATSLMHFPFLTSEVKCGSGGLDVADRQNAHSMTLAVRAVVELFRQVNRSDELNQEILAFSVSHDAQSVRVYGHYPIMEGSKVSYYQHQIETFDLTVGRGKHRWGAYKLITSLYKRWVPRHLERIRSAIDALPGKTVCGSVDGTQELESSQVPLTPFGSSTTTDARADDHHDTVGAGPPTPDTSFSGPTSSKRQKT